MTLRLICTYRGPGTQLGLPGDDGDVEDPVTLPTGSPAWLRGRLWPATSRQKLLHRSPPINSTGITRLVLVLDPVDDPDEAF